MARLVIIIASLPSIHKTSHIRSCCEKGTVLTKRVIYHLVPHAVVEIIFRCYEKMKEKKDSVNEGAEGGGTRRDRKETYERLIEIRYEPFH